MSLGSRVVNYVSGAYKDFVERVFALYLEKGLLVVNI